MGVCVVFKCFCLVLFLVSLSNSIRARTSTIRFFFFKSWWFVGFCCVGVVMCDDILGSVLNLFNLLFFKIFFVIRIGVVCVRGV